MEPAVFFLGCIGSFFLIVLVVQIFFLLALSRALAVCAPHHRTMEPGMVWLNLIPIFNWVWMFITVIRVAETLENEHRARGLHRRNETYGHGLGIAMCISPLGGLWPFLVLTIVYWVQIAKHTRTLETESYYDPGDYDDDYDDDYEERRRRRRRDDRDDRADRDRDDDDRDRRREGRPWDRGAR